MSEPSDSARSLVYIIAVFIGPLMLAAGLFFALTSAVGMQVEIAAAIAMLVGGADYFVMRFVMGRLKF